MSTQILQYSLANPIKLYEQREAFHNVTGVRLFGKNTAYNSVHVDESPFCKQLRSWQAKCGYAVPFQNSDRITAQFIGLGLMPVSSSSSIPPYRFHLLDIDGNVAKTYGVSDQGLLGSTTNRIYNLDVSIYDVQEGIYFLQLEKILKTYPSHSPNEEASLWISEPLHIKQKHNNTILAEYRHSENIHNVFYSTGITFNYRFHGDILNVVPKTKAEVYENQPLDLTLLSAKPYRDYELVLGTAANYVPIHVVETVDRIMCHDDAKLDGLNYTRSENSLMELQPNDKSALMTGKLNVRQSNNKLSLVSSSGTNVSLGPIPQNGAFFIDVLNGEDMQAMFKNQQELIDFLNSLWVPRYDLGASYFYIDANNMLWFHGDTAAHFNIINANPTITGLLQYYFTFDIEADASSAIAFAFSQSASSYSHVFWGDGIYESAQSSSTLNTYVTHTYASAIKTRVYIFVKDEVIQFYDNSSDTVIVGIGGKFGTNLQIYTLDFHLLRGLTENPFYGAINLEEMHIDSNEFNEQSVIDLINYLYEANLYDTVNGLVCYCANGASSFIEPTNNIIKQRRIEIGQIGMNIIT